MLYKGIYKVVINTYINHSTVDDMADLRQKLFSQMKKSIENLPIREALHCKILISYYMMYLSNNSLSLLLYKPDLTLYG